jgi:hypothetical protein
MVWRKMATSSANASRAGHSGEAVAGASPFRKRSILAPFKASLDLFYEFLYRLGLPLLLFGSLAYFGWVLWSMDYSNVGSG